MAQKKSPSSPPRNAAAKQSNPPATATASETSETVERADSLPFPIVGIGASAGGLEAASQLLKALPADTGMAFVVVQHLAPTHSSMLAEILGRATAMPTVTVEDGMAIEPNHVYVIPPGSTMELVRGQLRLSPRRKADGSYRPIDLFLRSLAVSQGHQAVAVILSGTANDGTLGCGDIKAEGGITFAQDDSAQQDSMPKSAAASGCVDFVMAPDAIAREIGRISRHPLVSPVSERHGENDLGGVLDLLREVTGVDLKNYKTSTLLRRITRRMVLHKVDDVKSYERLVTSTPAEAEALLNDILISVTSFFRNPEAFEALKEAVFPKITKDRNRHLPVRIWVLGCSTGEEAYSVAMAFTEYAAAVGRSIPVQIFASDLSGAGIEKARAGVYSKAIEQDLTPARLQRFFVSQDGNYRIIKSIREMVVFAHHNALTDPPFARIDLITCRNLLIYLDPTLHQRLLPVLHYGLRPDGFLWLGAAESTGTHRHLFEAVDPKFKIYQRKPGPAQPAGFTRPADRAALVPVPREKPAEPARQVTGTGGDPQREADRLLLSRYAPAGVLVNSDFDILQFRGDTGPYLSPAPGRASLNLLKMLREGLIVGVRTALLKAKREGGTIRQGELTVREDQGEARRVSVEVIPFKASSMRETCFMVLFDDRSAAQARARPKVPTGRPGKPLRGDRAELEVERLRQELSASREHLQSVIEQQEAANEELQSANEEVQSANEELQSINEELETSKEEIQSSSEELATVNEELSHRNLELSNSHNDLSNLITSVQMAIVMVGPDLRIRRYTPPAEKVLNLIGSDIGRPIDDIKTNLDIPELDTILLEVMESVTPREQITRDKRGRWYALRIRPYRTLDNKIDGVVLTLIDIDALKQTEAALRKAGDRLAILQEQAPVGIRETDAEGRYTQVNGRYCAITGYTQDELLGRRFTELIVSEDRPRALELWQQVVAGEIASYRDERRYQHKGGHTIWVEVQGFAIRGEDESERTGVAFIQDISERKQADAELRAADRSKNEFIAMLAHELRNPLAPLLNVAQLLGLPETSGARLESLRGVLERQIRNLSRMTDDLLDVSRVSQGKMRLSRDVVELVPIVARAVDLFRPAIEARGQHFTVELPAGQILVDADAVRLEQIVDNLLTNASKFTDPGGNIRLSLTARPSGTRVDGEADRRMAEIRVRDDGRGIPPELLPRIFLPFTQGDHSIERTSGGLGIGLSLVHSLVELHGGTVEARSEGLGKGAEFIVRLPLTRQPLSAPAPEPAWQQSIRGRARRVFVVDDNEDGAQTLAVLLRGSGYEVEVLGDGNAVLGRALELQPDVVLLDIGLPGKDGFEVTQELRARPETRHVLVVAISGYGQDEDRRRAIEVGVDHYFTKPIDIEALRALLAGRAPPPAEAALADD